MFINYKPLNLTISNVSVMILPPVVPKSSDVSEWAGSTAYTYGTIVSNGVNLYWCMAAGTSAATGGPTQTDGDEVDGTATWRYLRPVRNRFSVVNDSSETIYIAFGNAAVANKGSRLNASGGAYNSPEEGDCPQGAVYAIGASAGSHKVTIQES